MKNKNYEIIVNKSKDISLRWRSVPAPQRGELITHPKGFEIEIKEVDQRKIINVRFRLKVK